MHKNFYSFSATTYFDLGFQMGQKFQAEAQQTLAQPDKKWLLRKATAQKMLPITEKYFPQYVAELKGYAQGAKVDFLDLWTLSLEDDAFVAKNRNHGQCTTLMTNGGLLIAHNEDGPGTGRQNDICIVKKKIGGVTSLEIFYYNTIGGTSVGINSHGYVQTVNTLFFTRRQIGVPTSIVSRFLMDTKNPEADIDLVKKLKRASGYNHTLIAKNGQMWNVELTPSTAKTNIPAVPFAHSNHCLIGRQAELQRDSSGTATRLRTARKLLRPEMTESELMKIQADTSAGTFSSIMNERTIGKIMINLKTLTAKIWLLRENEMGWVDYKLDFIK